MSPSSPVSPSSLSNRVTILVFWGLVLAGIAFAVLLLHDQEARARADRELVADSAMLHVIEHLQRGELAGASGLGHGLVDLLQRHQLKSLRLSRGDETVLQAGDMAAAQDRTSHVLAITEPDGVLWQLEIGFPPLEVTLHRERRNLLLGLGVLLLVLGVSLRAVLEQMLTRPLLSMVDTARAISRGDREARFNDTAAAEFGYLARFINEALSGLRESESELREARDLAEVTLSSIADGVLRTDASGRVIYLNPVAERLLSCSHEACLEAHVADLFTIEDEQTGMATVHPVLSGLSENRTIGPIGERLLVRSDGSRLPISYSVSPVRDGEGRLNGAVMVIHDASVARQLKEELSYYASHDPVTGLYNRTEFERELRRLWERAHRDKSEHSLCYFDLDQFKVINDTCGHAAGDQLLRELGAHLSRLLRKSDVLARLGGDEFGLLLPHCGTRRALDVAEKLREAVNAFEFVWEGRSYHVGVSVGLVPINHESETVDELLAAADMACYAAKEDGRNRIHVHHAEDQAIARRREEMGMVTAVRKALSEDRFVLMAQAIVPTREREAPQRYEVLVRMLDEEGKFVSPGLFIPAAERFQLMAAVDRWVVRNATEALARVRAGGVDAEFSINLSGQSLGEEDFVDFLHRTVSRHPGLARHVCFEITETAAINHIGRALEMINDLRALGCRFALDDFGSGLSSFGYLKKLPLDYLKIDGSFIRNLDKDAEDRAMVRAIHEVARVMNTETVAEFVENEASFRILGELGVEWGQGYWLGKPQPLEELFPTALQAEPGGLRLIKS